MSTDRRGPARFLSAADVDAAMPPVEQRLALARRALVALGSDTELPPKIAVHPRPSESFAHAMPAFVRGRDPDGQDDLLGIKWVTGFPGNRAAGLPTLDAVILVSDPRTGRLRAILDGGPITAHRTAAVSGVAIERWRPAAAGPLRICLVGAGVQARSHLPVLGHLLHGSSLVVTDVHAGRAEALAREARDTDAFSGVSVVADAAEAVSGAQVVLTMVSFGPDRQGIPAEAFTSARLIVAVDYDMCVPADVASQADRFLVDERGQFLANRATGIFVGYPDPVATIGETLREGDAGARGAGNVAAGAGRGAVLVTHLGVGSADLVFADAVLDAADRLGLGMPLSAIMQT